MTAEITPQHPHGLKRATRTLAHSIREIVFGLEDSLVSTIGVVAGIAAGTGSHQIIILSGLVLVVVEALSMSAGSYLSSQSHRGFMLKKIAAEQDAIKGKNPTQTQELKSIFHQLRLDELEEEVPGLAAGVMGVAYIAGGTIPITPFFFLPVSQALPLAFGATLIALFALGYWSGSVTGDNKIRSAFEMVLVSSMAAVIGYAIGKMVSLAFGIEVV